MDRTSRTLTIWVTVHNVGPDVARDVGITATHEGAGIDFSREAMGVIHPGGQMIFGVGPIGPRVGVVVDVVVTWRDQAGEHSDLFRVTCTNV